MISCFNTAELKM